MRPETLRAASKEFEDGADATGDGADLISMLRLDAGALGQVPAAAEFVDALARWAGEQSDDLRRGAAWYRDAGAGLAENAESYQRAEDATTQSFRSFDGGAA
ncbi:hypothetical protein [Actinosynnema sp. NPDC020468]|uniref:hypothetical protein n=1 Tax=Actinosynnema sp. NPDC020468 TaxID=3154488 RepID=UPI0033D186A3